MSGNRIGNPETRHALNQHQIVPWIASPPPRGHEDCLGILVARAEDSRPVRLQADGDTELVALVRVALDLTEKGSDPMSCPLPNGERTPAGNGGAVRPHGLVQNGLIRIVFLDSLRPRRPF
jgi:hypothetical protein